MVVVDGEGWRERGGVTDDILYTLQVPARKGGEP